MFVVSAESFMDAQFVAWLRHPAASGRAVTHRHKQDRIQVRQTRNTTTYSG